jgi:dihydrofolate reductase
MVTGHVFIATSLDGFIAREDGGIDWLPMQADPGEDYGYQAFMDSVDGLVVGRHSFEKVLSFGEWPYPKPAVVMSSVLDGRMIRDDLKDKLEISNASPAALLQQLGVRGWKRVYVDGGQLIQSFLKAGLIADMVITRVPILLGKGRPLFGPVGDDIDLRHVETRAYPSGLVQSRYEIAT